MCIRDSINAEYGGQLGALMDGPAAEQVHTKQERALIDEVLQRLASCDLPESNPILDGPIDYQMLLAQEPSKAISNIIGVVSNLVIVSALVLNTAYSSSLTPFTSQELPGVAVALNVVTNLLVSITACMVFYSTYIILSLHLTSPLHIHRVVVHFGSFSFYGVLSVLCMVLLITAATLAAWLNLDTPQALSLIHISEPTRLLSISYAVFCLKKKKKKLNEIR
eukprot:TRINITY_DN56153_c0_g1_i2.p1 TRINITY_DN56153_c0_g1~~TRINITY_DN56153_c0_g1_i2.p1  ORF type:complete len:254 (+),score=79.15 TRINITY_DN56153_c0_g1_i2:99-764(+)